MRTRTSRSWAPTSAATTRATPSATTRFAFDAAAAGASVTLETNVAFQGPPRWRPTGEASLTVDGEATVNFLLGRCQLRAVVADAGASAATDLTVTVTCHRGR